MLKTQPKEIVTHNEHSISLVIEYSVRAVVHLLHIRHCDKKYN